MLKARVRTESMVQRFAKKPISEGYDLWDCDYPFGALRLFIFKSETAPPFQLGPCLDAMAEISMQMGSDEDAVEQYRLAADKYRMINQPILSGLMKAKATEVTDGAVAALEEMDGFLANVGKGGSHTDMRTRSAVARCHVYRAELLLAVNKKSNAISAMEAATEGVNMGWDRVHTGYLVLGGCCEAAGRLEEAKAAYERAVEHCPRYVQALQSLLALLKRLGADPKDRLAVAEQAITAHPKADLIREKAFLLSTVQSDAAALAFLATTLENPPLEEMEAVGKSGGATLATLYMAEASIRADAGEWEAAAAATAKALQAYPDHKEAKAMAAELKAMPKA